MYNSVGDNFFRSDNQPQYMTNMSQPQQPRSTQMDFNGFQNTQQFFQTAETHYTHQFMSNLTANTIDQRGQTYPTVNMTQTHNMAQPQPRPQYFMEKRYNATCPTIRNPVTGRKMFLGQIMPNGQVIPCSQYAFQQGRGQNQNQTQDHHVRGIDPGSHMGMTDQAHFNPNLQGMGQMPTIQWDHQSPNLNATFVGGPQGTRHHPRPADQSAHYSGQHARPAKRARHSINAAPWQSPLAQSSVVPSPMAPLPTVPSPTALPPPPPTTTMPPPTVPSSDDNVIIPALPELPDNPDFGDFGDLNFEDLPGVDELPGDPLAAIPEFADTLEYLFGDDQGEDPSAPGPQP